MKKIKSYTTINNKKYEYSLEKRKSGEVFIECSKAKIAQEFLAEDVPNLLIDLPNLIMAEKEYKKKQSEIVRFRISPQDKKRVEQKAVKQGFKSVSGYLRNLALS